ncbi:MAG: tRNA (N6-isopentenyl adenosine(37)-C2)-methylthiotransferase MiaB [Rhodospirillales bacterium]|nr:tRNA (N6-isopentenyl adenosine(37)-C2)-methylthiotransferase MiaB [Alphaproteobacteria bacterium]MCB9987438.1 tRNA (N6-isopentenyl adenosine(37)-C2)-methylthiotransferase MiaB [Rhodospirillales bacterium]USO08652.1 MAG: tRNA (N6-isopentenyl adenosine(37)-C2)-methylthiotransferase MiaB [Rhodospirillales bacterium]
MGKTKTVFIKTYGCQMNEYDSRRMTDVLAPLGYVPAEAADDADMVILNTCHIREKATDKVFSDLGRMRAHKEAREARGEKTILAVAGCVAQAEGEFIARRAPYVDMVFGPQTYHRLPEMMIAAGAARVVNTDFPAEAKFDHMPAPGAQGPSAFLSVQEGCDKFCTFCVVPYTRGAEYSRGADAILAEARHLADQGVRDITLLGQNVNAWHGANGESLGDLLFQLHEAVPEIAQWRYMTSHPRDMHERLYEAHALPRVMPYVHLPVQSGSDAVLHAMNRKHTARDYLDIIARLRKLRPDIAFSSDFIVGFPGENEAQFDQTMALVRAVGFASAYSFKYSARPGTPAATMGGLVREDVKTERLARLQDLLNAQRLEFNRSLIGRVLPVLLENPTDRAGQMYGRTPYNQGIHVDAPARLAGHVVDVTVEDANINSLKGCVEIRERATG